MLRDLDFDHLSRRRFLAAGAGAALLGLTARSRAQDAAPAIPVTGLEVPSMASFDRMMLGLLDKHKVPGGSLAVMRNGRLIFARGYGWADAEKTKPVQPSSLFRIGSVSKPITAVAILKLVEQGKLDLDERAWTILDVEPPPGKTMDARLRSITIRQLLQHSGGWDRDANKSSELFQAEKRIAQFLGKPLPVSTDDILRFIAAQPLDFAPGTRHAYANQGYFLLGRIIEKSSGLSYEEFVRREVLAPAGIRRMAIGRSRLNERTPDEVNYFDRPDAPQNASVLEDGKVVARPDGGFSLELWDSAGAWLASPADLMRFVRAFDPTTPPQALGGAVRLLSNPALVQMVGRPDLPQGKDAATFYAMGWHVRPKGDDANLWHGGAMPGAEAYLVRLAGGLSWAMLFNARPGGTFRTELDRSPSLALREVTSWPRHDLFPQLP